MSKATEYFQLRARAGIAEETLGDAVIAALGCDPSTVESWPGDDYKFDDTDMSCEFKNVRLAINPTPEQLSRVWALGFRKLYLCYVDGTERLHTRK